MLFVLLLCLLPGKVLLKKIALSTTAYDCGIRRPNDMDIATYSLLDTVDCDRKKNTINVTSVEGQIVQKSKIKEVMVFQCKIKLHRTVQRCSLFGYLEPVDNGVQEYLLELSREQCKKLHETGFFAYNSQTLISDVKVNETTTRSIYLAGDAVDNSCNTGSFSDRYGSYSKVIVHGLFKITLTSYTAKLDVNNNRIFLTTGLSCDYDLMSCIDSLNGLTIWEHLKKENCFNKELELIYEGKITVFTEPWNNDTKITYAIDTNEYMIMMEHKGSVDICNNRFIRTQSAESYVIIGKENFIKSTSVHVDLKKYFNNKIFAMYKLLNQEMKQVFLDKIDFDCKTKASLIKQSLTMAHLAPDLFAYNLMGPGYTAVLAGHIIHVIKCQPVEVTINQYPKSCTEEIPILYHESPYFITSTTKIIIKHSRKTTCNKILPTQFKINGRWIEFTPTLRYTETPKTLGQKSKDLWQPAEIRDLENRGIYSKEDMEEYTRKINFPIERQIILDNTAKDVKDIIDIEKLDSSENFFIAYIQHHARRYWQQFKDFGSTSAAICTILIILGAFIWLTNIILNALQIRRVVGCSSALGAALFSSLTNKILRKTESRKQRIVEENIELAEVRTEKILKSHLISKKRKQLKHSFKRRLTANKIRNSFRKIKYRNKATQANIADSE